MTDNEREQGDGTLNKTVSRREFLKIAGVAGAAVGLGAGLGGVVAACGGTEEETTTTAAAGETTTTAAAGGETTTSVSTDAEMAGEIKTGYVVPLTGSMAQFGAAAEWQVGWMEKNVWKDGLVCGDGKKYKITTMIGDSQSDSNRSAQVAGDLITNSGISIIGGSSSASNVIPVRDQAEALECPGVYYDCPGDAWAADLTEPLKWNWCAWWVGKDVVGNFLSMWDQIPNNKTVGALWENTADGANFANVLPGIFKEKGLTLSDPGIYQTGTEDYTQIINQFKKDGVEVICGMSSPPDFANFWKQSVQQDYKPKIVTVAKALLFPDGVNALGELGDGMTVEAWYHPTFPYTSDITGMTPQQYCDAYEADTGLQWTQPVCFIGCFELWTDILKRTKNPMDKNSIVEAIKATKVTATGGPVDWTVNPEPVMGYYNFCTKPIAGGQWVKGTGKYKYDLQLVASATHTDIKTTATMKEVQYPA
jgi:branched-chain amino acid transport system substrate-binding protein